MLRKYNLENLGSNHSGIGNLVVAYREDTYKESPAQFIIDLQAAYSDAVGYQGLVASLKNQVGSKNRRVSVLGQAFYQEALDYLTTDYDTNMDKYLQLDMSNRTSILKLNITSNAIVHKNAISELETILAKGGLETALTFVILTSTD